MTAVLRVEEPSARYLVQLEPPIVRGFDLLTTARSGVTLLRSLVSALAVQGLLLPQDPEDEPASILLGQVSAERDRLRSKPDVKSAKGARLLDDDELGITLPRSWVWARFGELIDASEAGWSPNCEGGARAGSCWGVLKVSAVSWGEFRPYENKALPTHLEARSEFEVRDGDFLISRANTAQLVARSVVVSKPEPHLMLSDKIIRLQLSRLVDKQFFNLVNNSRMARDYYAANASGTSSSMKNVGREDILGMPVPVPPLAEQHRIVARVEELMKLCDALEQNGRLADEQHARLTSTLFDALAASESAHALAENWQRVAEHFDLLLDRPEAIDALEQTILQLAVRGLLVVQDSSDEAASALLMRIRAERERMGKISRSSREVPLLDVGDDTEPFDLPTGWAWARFAQLGEFGRGKSKHRPRNDPSLFSPGIYPLIQTGEVSRACQFITEVHSHYSDVGLAQSRLWPAGTLCITIAANIADSAILSFDACFPDSVVGFIPAKAFDDARYFLVFMKTARQRLIDFAPSTAQKNINLDVLNSVLIPLPPLAEQHRIVARVEELRRLCDDLRHRLAQARETQSRLADALVAEVA